MKEALPHGHSDKWVEAEFEWSKGTALNIMLVAKEFGDKFETVAYLPPRLRYGRGTEASVRRHEDA